MQPLSSAITGVVEAATPSSSTGGKPSAPALPRLPDASQARDKLVTQTPTQTDRNLLAWLELSLGVVAKPRISLRFPTGKPYVRVNEGFDVSGLTADNRRQAIEAVSSSMTRPTQDQVESWIGGLAAVTASRSQSDDVSEVALGLYVARLSQYPADVVQQVCMDFALRREKPNWFPTLSEIDEACEKAAENRKALLREIER